MKNVVILGGGASGAILATHLLRTLNEADRITVVEPSEELGRGIAYAKSSTEFLLNVRAIGLSIDPDSPRDFVAWLENHGYTEPEQQFLPRERFGDYVSDRLRKAIEDSQARFKHVQSVAETVSESKEGITIDLANGTRIQGITHVVVATGNRKSKVLSELATILDSGKVIVDPFSDFETQLPSNGSVLILGSGLTCIDTLTKLERSNWTGKTFVRSRSGLFPQPHANPTPPAATDLPNEYRSAIKEFLTVCRRSGADWRPYVDGLRPKTAKIWQSWSWQERKSFLHRFGTLWNVHRHRAPQEVWDPIRDAIHEGKIDAGSGRLLSANIVNGQIVATFRSETITCDLIVCCMTPEGLLGEKLPVIESLIQGGFARYDALGIGLEIDETLRLTDKRFFGIGPVAKGCLFESTAIPEIRNQAQQIATEIARA